MRAFWPVASIIIFVAALYLLVALWVTFNPASGCTVDGRPCASVGIASLVLYIVAPALSLVAVVLVGIRIRRHSPRAAVAWVASPLLIISAMVAASFIGGGR
jgi:cytochrome bd-type quinol oxidase subunit 2